MKKFKIILILCISILADLSDVSYFAYQLQGLDVDGAVDALVMSNYDMLILEPSNTETGMEWFDTADMVTRCKSSSGATLANKIVVAYINVGEAEEWRTYWQSWWEAPTETEAGVPDFIVEADPDGWAGNYPVAYWDSRWQDIIINDENSLLRKAIEDGFDGIFMDWVAGFEEAGIVARAAADGVDPQVEMINFIQAIRDTARRYNPDFYVIAQNASDLYVGHPEYFAVIDAISQESLHFGGDSDVPWGHADAGDITTDPEFTEYLIERLDLFQANDVTVFSVEYALVTANVDAAFAANEALGYVSFVSQTPLSQLPDYYPVGYDISESIIKPDVTGLVVFPNPFNSKCEISYSMKNPCTLTIHDIRGREVLRTLSADGSVSWDASGFGSGVYLVRVFDGQEALSRKIVLTR